MYSSQSTDLNSLSQIPTRSQCPQDSDAEATTPRARSSRRGGWWTTLLLTGLTLTAPIWAAPIQVTTTDATHSQECTLAEAIAVANAGQATGSGDDCQWDGVGDPVIELVDGTYETAGVIPFTINVGVTMKIEGDGYWGNAGVIIRRDPADPVRNFFKVRGTLTLFNLTLTGGQAGAGGAINLYQDGALTVDLCRLVDNVATDKGGAIHSRGALIVTNSIFEGNSADYRGGAIYEGSVGTINISQSAFVDNSSAGDGGAIAIFGKPAAPLDLEIENSTFSGNHADWGGAVAIVRGKATIDMSTFKDNTSTTYGSAIAVTQASTARAWLERSALDREDSPVIPDLCDGPVISNGNNAASAQDASCDHDVALGDQVLDDLYLSELVDHHGLFSPVHVPLCSPGPGPCGSPLMEQYVCDATVVKDQRGWFARNTNYNGIHTGALCDIGAYESVYTSADYDDTAIDLELNGYQTGSGPTSRKILDNGGGPNHQLSFPDAPNPAANDCRVNWVAPGPFVLYIRDVIFIAESCAHDCFSDPGLCVAECEGSDPAGWVPDDAGESTAADHIYGFDVPCVTDVSTGDFRSIVVEYYHQDDETLLQQGDLTVLRHWDPLNPPEECTGPSC